MSNGLRWSNEELVQYRAKQRACVRADRQAHADPVTADQADPGPESDLQERIERWCEERGFVYFHDKSRRVNRRGFLDLVIALPFGRTLWIEAKAKGGRLTKEQELEVLKLLALGHKVHVVRSFVRFLEIAKVGEN